MKEPVTNKQKLYYTIGEVSDMFNVNQSLLRYWETEFKTINPKRSPKGTRYYSQKDIEEIKLIHYLLKERKMKIEGAKQVLKHKKRKYRSVPTSSGTTEITAFRTNCHYGRTGIAWLLRRKILTISRKFLTLLKQIWYTIHTEDKPQNRPATIGEKIIPVRASPHRHSTLQQLHQATPHNSPAHEQNQLGSGKLRYPIYIKTAYPNKPQIHTTVHQLIGSFE